MNVLSLLLARRRNIARIERPMEPSIDFTKLPADILPIVLHSLFEGHRCFEPPERACRGLRKLLDLRTVCRAFDREIDRLLHQRIKFPNLPARFHFWQDIGCPDYTTARAWNKILASALFNSTLSYLAPITSRPPKLIEDESDHRLQALESSTKTLPYRTKMIVRYIAPRLFAAQDMLADYSLSGRKDILRALCTALSESQPFSHVVAGIISLESRQKPTPADMYCIAAILGCVSFFKNEAKKEGRTVLTGSYMFGCPLSCAIHTGNIDIVEFLLDPKTAPRVSVDRRDIEGVIAAQDRPMLGLLLKAWIDDKVSAKDGKGLLHLRQLQTFAKRATDAGRADLEQCILSHADEIIIASMQLNGWNKEVIGEDRDQDGELKMHNWPCTSEFVSDTLDLEYYEYFHG